MKTLQTFTMSTLNKMRAFEVLDIFNIKILLFPLF